MSMKNKTFIIVAAAFLTLSSCDNTGSYLDTGRFIIYADREDIQSTKTEIQDGTSVVWKKGDAIAVFVYSGATNDIKNYKRYKFVSRNEVSSSSTEFEGDVKLAYEFADEDYYAVYPYDAASSCENGYLTVELPSTQVAKAGSFGDDLFISVASSPGNTNKMTFRNVCGGIKFSVDYDDIREVVISNNDGRPMSGTLKIWDGKVESISGSPDLRVIAPFGETFTKDAKYYAVIPPIAFSKGVTIKYITTEGKESSPIALPSSTIDRSVFSRLPDIETPVNFTYSPYLTFVSAGESSLSFNTSSATLQYSYDGVTWWNVSNYVIKMTKRQPQVLLRGINAGGHVEMSGDQISCHGSVMKLTDYRKDVTTAQYCMSFKDCKALTRAPDLPATTLAEYCYAGMFSGCTSLVSAPELPATTLAESCYKGMFSGCTSLVSAPELPSTTLAESCYEGMFSGCTSLVSAPELPATTLAEYCYSSMFSGCRSLVSTPELPAMTLAESCCNNMFNGCTSLVTVPEILPATTLAQRCYESMFSGCTSLVSAPELPATTLAKYCCNNMFNGCTSLVTVPEILPATTLAENCYEGMFSGCTSLVSAPDLPATTLAENCCNNMFEGCTSLVTVPQILPATTLAWSCYEEMFSGCRSLVSAPDLPATTLANYCYHRMFSNCYSLKSAPNLPATTLARSCYEEMFSGCRSLVSAPDLPATTLAWSCYEEMFFGCTSLVSAPDLPATTLAWYCYEGMFTGCTSLVSAPELPATTLAEYCYSSMFSSCTSLSSAPELPATTLVKNCYNSMFRNCSNLKSVTALFEKSVTNSLNGWLTGVSSIGTFYKNAEAVWENSGIIPDGWDVVLVTP